LLEAKTTTLTARKISGLPFQSRVNYTFGPTSATTAPLDGAPELLTPCSGSITVKEHYLRPTTIPLPSTLVAIPWPQQSAFHCPLVITACALGCAAVTQRRIALTAGTIT
jgi:hypothetical protein